MGVICLMLSACGSATTSEGSNDNGQPAAHSRVAERNAADVAFARNMIPHHQQALDMAAMVPSSSANADLRVMATHIASDQRAEIETMTALLARWGESEGSGHDAPGGHDGMAMQGMVDGATLDRIRSSRGTAFDTAWITAMIGHHRGAVAMAQTEMAHGQSPEAVKLAEWIVAAQQREIAQMNRLLNVTE